LKLAAAMKDAAGAVSTASSTNRDTTIIKRN
jgi:hypothetical protein